MTEPTTPTDLATLIEEECVFCQIVAGDAAADVVATGDRYIVIRPLNPHVPGHLLFIPRVHVADATIDTELTGHLFAAAAAFPDGYGMTSNLLTSIGAEATQTVMHLHVHLLPRGDDGLPPDWPWMRDALRQVITHAGYVRPEPAAEVVQVTPGGNPVCERCGRWYGIGVKCGCPEPAAVPEVGAGLSDSTLAEWQRLADEATQGPWTFNAADNLHDDAAGWVGHDRTGDGFQVFVCTTANHLDGLTDGAFIAAAREAVPALIAEVTRLREGLSPEAVRAECDHPGIDHGPHAYTGICPKCRRCKFIGHGPLCGDCYTKEGR